MANTGKKIVLTLKERKDPAGTLTGNKKDNVPTDPNYIPDYIDPVSCPLVFSTNCPVILSTKTGTNLYYEFTLSNDVVTNPAVKKIVVSTSVGGFAHTYLLPNSPSPNYFTNTFTGLNSITHYDLVVTYLNTGDVLVHTCNITVP